MLAHNVKVFEATFDPSPPKLNFLMRFLVKTFAKSSIIGDKPYPQSMRTAPGFIIDEAKDFEAEKAELLKWLEKTQTTGKTVFGNKSHPALGKLSLEQWNVLISKHLDHHLRQFGV